MENNREITVNNAKINVVLKPRENTALSVIKQDEPSIKSQMEDTYTEIFEELNSMVGLKEVKEVIYQIYAILKVNKLRQEMGLKANNQVYHMVFKGNAGTGKTTLARIIAKLFKAMGVLSKGHFIEVERADLVGEYIGHTAQKTRDLVRKAMGGILFIDEAYSLARGGEKDFGKEAIDCLVKSMEDNKHDFILILAGYPAETDYFLQTNPGLPSRFPIQIEFPDYNLDELMSIADKMLLEKEYVLARESVTRLNTLIINEKLETDNFSNGRFIRNVLEKAIRHQAVRLMSRNRTLTKQDLMDLLPQDFLLENEIKVSDIFVS